MILQQIGLLPTFEQLEAGVGVEAGVQMLVEPMDDCQQRVLSSAENWVVLLRWRQLDWTFPTHGLVQNGKMVARTSAGSGATVDSSKY